MAAKQTHSITLPALYLTVDFHIDVFVAEFSGSMNKPY